MVKEPTGIATLAPATPAGPRAKADYTAVTAEALACCQHLYSFDQKAPHNDKFSTRFNRKALRDAMDRGRKLIGPLIADFMAVAVTQPLPKGGRGVFYCNTPAKVAHGCPFEIADKLLTAIENDTDAGFVNPEEIRGLWTAICGEATDLRASTMPELVKPDNADAYVLVSKVWPEHFETYRKFQAWLKRNPTIRTKKLADRRLGIHAADWAEHWAAGKNKAFNVDPDDVEKDAIEARIEAARTKKQAGY